MIIKNHLIDLIRKMAMADTIDRSNKFQVFELFDTCKYANSFSKKIPIKRTSNWLGLLQYRQPNP